MKKFTNSSNYSPTHFTPSDSITQVPAAEIVDHFPIDPKNNTYYLIYNPKETEPIWQLYRTFLRKQVIGQPWLVQRRYIPLAELPSLEAALELLPNRSARELSQQNSVEEKKILHLLKLYHHHPQAEKFSPAVADRPIELSDIKLGDMRIIL